MRSPQAQDDQRAWGCISQLGGQAALGPRTGISLGECVKNSVRNYNNYASLSFP